MSGASYMAKSQDMNELIDAKRIHEELQMRL
jgi:hypothetical protein